MALLSIQWVAIERETGKRQFFRENLALYTSSRLLL